MSTTVLCPSCSVPLTGAPACEACELPLTGPAAARLWQVDQQLEILTTERGLLLEQLRSGDTVSTSVALAGLSGARSSISPVAVPPLPPATQRPAATLTGQQVLLGAGVLLLLVASVVFLAVTWSLIGVAGQVAVMGAATAVAAMSAPRFARRGLRSTGEAVAILASGLAVADVAAARAMNLFGLGSVDLAGYTCAGAAVLAGAAAAASRQGGALRTFPVASVVAAAVVPCAAMAAVDDRLHSAPSSWPLLAAIALVSSAAFFAGASRIARANASSRDGVAGVACSPALVPTVVAGWAYLAAGMWVGIPGVFHGDVVGAGGASAALLLTAAVVLIRAAAPAPTTAQAGAEAAAGAGHDRRSVVPAVRAAASTVAVAAVTGAVTGLAWHGGANCLTAVAVVSGAAVSLVAALPHLRARVRQAGTAAGTVSTEATEIGVLAVGHGLMLATTAAIIADAFDQMADQRASGAFSIVFPLTTQLTVTLVSIVVASVATATRTLGSTFPGAARVAAVFAGYANMAAVFAFTVALGDEAAVPLEAALLALALVTLAIGASRRGTALEAACGLTAFVDVLVAGCFAATQSDPNPNELAVILAVTGLATLAYATLPQRGAVAAVGVLSCAAATWTLSAAHDVDVIEAYTLPLAALAAAVGAVRVRRDPHAPSWATVGPALSAALLPSSLAAIGDPDLTRPTLVLLAGAVVLVAGVHVRWQAPVVTGTVAVTVVALSQVGPLTSWMPRWVLLAAVGAALLAVGARYEQRRRDLQSATTWVRNLR